MEIRSGLARQEETTNGIDADKLSGVVQVERQVEA
jgi:hypothetical protein